MFLRGVVLGSFATFVLVARLAAQEPFGIDAYVGIVLKAHPRAGQTRAVEGLAAAERRVAGAWPDPLLGVSTGHGKGVPDGQVAGGEWDYSISQGTKASRRSSLAPAGENRSRNRSSNFGLIE